MMTNSGNEFVNNILRANVITANGSEVIRIDRLVTSHHLRGNTSIALAFGDIANFRKNALIALPSARLTDTVGATNGIPTSNLNPATYSIPNFVAFSTAGAATNDMRLKTLVSGSRNTYLSAGDGGNMIGADPNEYPDIRSVVVDASDRAAIIRYNVGMPQRAQTCSIEVGTDPVMEGGYIADQDTATYPRPDIDNGVGGLTRWIAIGSNVPLTASADYNFRIHCGGGLYEGSFTTLPTMSGTATLSKTKGTLASMGYGYAYDRSTITDSSAASCASNTCTASSLTRGRVVYTSTSGTVSAYIVR
jgi:hypothetical protein